MFADSSVSRIMGSTKQHLPSLCKQGEWAAVLLCRVFVCVCFFLHFGFSRSCFSLLVHSWSQCVRMKTEHMAKDYIITWPEDWTSCRLESDNASHQFNTSQHFPTLPIKHLGIDEVPKKHLLCRGTVSHLISFPTTVFADEANCFLKGSMPKRGNRDTWGITCECSS